MATNKRKESAALFELIGKSTLKVPKNSGSLKIPAWWSNKSNPGPESSPRAAPDDIPVTRKGISPARPVRATPVVAESREEDAAPAAPAQPRLFEAARGNALPGTSPSIRAPAPPGSAARAPAAPVPVPDIAPKVTEPLEEDELTAEPAAVPRVFAPNTHAQADFEKPGAVPRRVWSPPRAGSFARLPPWVLVAAVSFLVVILVIIVVIVHNNKSKAPVPDSHIIPSNIGTTQSRVGIPEMNSTTGRSLVPQNSRGGTPPVPNTANDGHQGHVYLPGQISHEPGKLYIVVLRTQTESAVKRDAQWIADNGVDVSIETYVSNTKLWYALISREGFGTREAAEPLRGLIVQIGRELPEYKKIHKGAWDDAAVETVVRAPPPTSAKG